MSDAQATAVAEVAKTTGEAIKAAGGVGGYLARVVGSIPDNLLGLVVGDWLEHKRRRHIAELEANTARCLEGIAAERLSEPSPSVLIPLLQACVDEGRPELQALWAALLANAMVDGGKRVRRDYFETVRQMEPSDALLLEIIGRHRSDPLSSNVIPGEAIKRGLSANELQISADKLVGLRCIMHVAAITPFGIGILEACQFT